MLLAIGRWARVELAELDTCAAAFPTASEQARAYFRAGAASLRPLSSAFREDVQRFESTRLLWSMAVTDPFVSGFVGLLDRAVEAGEVRPLNTRFIGEVIRQIAWVVRDEQELRASGITADQATLLVDEMIWTGILER